MAASDGDDILVLESPVSIVRNRKKNKSGSPDRNNQSPNDDSSSPSKPHSPASLFYDDGNSVVISVTQDTANQYLDVVAVSMITGWKRCLRFARAEMMRTIKFSPGSILCFFCLG